jgi:CelD/BcsL family acetyltransferase involved in cellulose biosynthesis
VSRPRSADTRGPADRIGVSVPTDSHLEVFSSLEELREDWTALARVSRNIFSTWEWASIWWRRYGVPHRPLVVACHDEREIAALLPLYLWSRRPLRIARFIGHGPADQLGPICSPAGRATGADALRSVAVQAELDLILAELLPGGEGWPQLLRERPLLAEASPTISLRDGWDAYLAGRSANLRQQLRRRERELHRRYDVRFRLASEPDQLQDDLSLMFALHRARWGPAESAFTRFEDFHRDFAAVALERGWLRLWFLELAGRPAAAWYGFRFAEVESYYQAGRDPGLRDDSVGFVLLSHTIRQAAEDGMQEYRLLRGDERFKLRFAEADAGVASFALGRGLVGRAARAAAGTGLRSSKARSVLRRLARRTPD